MTKIFDLVNFHTAYGSQVRLHDHYYDESENRSRLGGYMPISAHRAAFKQLAKAQLPDRNNKDKVFMLTGSYGTGKSHLCLMLANYFSQKSDSSSIKSFFDNWGKRDPEGAQLVKNIRGEGRYLVAICEFGTGKQFEDMVLSSIEEALACEGAEDIVLNTHFKGVLRQIEEWEKRREDGEPTGVYEDFVRFLGENDPDAELEKLKKELQHNSSKAMERFQIAYQKAIGQRFNMQNDTLKAVLEDMLRSPEFKDRYRGLVILADEFGYALSEGKVPMSVFQSFAEMSKDGVDGLPIIFVGVGHRRFEMYANSAALLDFRVVRDRVTEVSLESEELEQIIAALVSPRKEEAIWKTELQGHWLLTRMANETTKQSERKIKLFEYLKEPDLLEQIVRNIYPMHPLSVYCLTKMSQELGSDARSVFAFFRQNADIGSYVWFANTHDYKNADNSLNIYTPDMLVKYFEPEIVSATMSVRDTIRDHIRNYRAAVDEVIKLARSTFAGEVDPAIQQLLDLMFVYKVSGIPITSANLSFGLNYYNPDEKKKLGNALEYLKTNKVIFQGTSGEFEFRRSDMQDVEAMIKEQYQVVVNQPLDVSEKITKVAETLFQTLLSAQGFNASYQEDKRLRRIFATPQDLLKETRLADGTGISFWESIELERKNKKTWQERYDGVMVYILCEDENEIQNAQQAVRANHSNKILAGIPRTAMPVKEKILQYLAIKSFMDDRKYEKLDAQEKSVVAELYGAENRKSGRIGEVIKIRDQYLNAQGLTWYQQDGKILVSQPKTEYEPADALLTSLNKKRNQISHSTFNLAHPTKFAGSKDNALRDAVGRLIEYGTPVEIDVNEKESQGEIRYLRNVFFKEGVLQKTTDHLGSIAFYELVQDTQSFHAKLPALFELVNFLRSIGPGRKENIWPKLQEFTEAPYGIGPYALSLFMAVAVRYLGDELRLKPQPTQIGYAPLNDPEIIIAVATGSYPSATVERVEKTKAVTRLTDGIFKLFSETPSPAGSHQTLNAAWQSMLAWWKEQTRLERTSGIYTADSSAQKFAEMMTNYETLATAAQSFLDEVKILNGYDANADIDEPQAQEILKTLESCKQIIGTQAETIKHTIITSIGELFSPKGGTYLDYGDAIRTWFNGLHNDQKDRQAKWQTRTSITLLDALNKISDIQKLLLEDIPVSPAFNFGKVDDWTYDRTDDYVERFKSAKENIDNGMPKLPAPEWEVSQNPGIKSNKDEIISYPDQVRLAVTAPAGVIVRITKDEEPTQAKQFEVVGEGTSKSYTITDSCKYYLVSNAAGEFSKVITLTFRNKNDDYKPIPEAQGRLEPGNRFYTIRNPIDPNGLKALINNLILQIKSDGIIPEEDIKEALNEVIAQQFKKGK